MTYDTNAGTDVLNVVIDDTNVEANVLNGIAYDKFGIAYVSGGIVFKNCFYFSYFVF